MRCVTMSAPGQAQRLKNGTSALILNKRREMKVGGFPWRRRFQEAGDFHRSRRIHFKRAVEFPDHEIVAESAAAVFASGDIACQVVFVDRNIGLCTVR